MMKRYLLICVFVIIASACFAQVISLSNLKCDYKTDPAGIVSAPHLSWEIRSNKRNILQTAYRILVADNETSLQQNIGNVWDSKKVNSSASIQVTYLGKPLSSAKKYYWKVMVWDNKSHAAWSKIASWQMGLLALADWEGAHWIAYQDMADSMKILPGLSPKGKKHSPGTDVLPMLRKQFSVSKPIKSATMFISGLGHFEMSLNGKKVGDHSLDGGWVNFEKEAQYVSFDLTDLLKQGNNAIGVMLGNGFYFTPTGRYRKLTVAYGYPKMICRLAVEYQDGTSENIVSNTSWKITASPITFSSIYGGEDYNATKEQAGWDMPLFNAKGWQNAIAVTGPAQLEPQSQLPVKIFEAFTAKKITQPKPGVWVYDLGQNASGIPQITVKGKKGDTVTIIPSELLDKDGLANQKNTGASGKSTLGHWYTYVLKGDGVETWQPRFTYYGFRYLQLQGGVPQGEANTDGKPVVVNLKSLHTRNSAERVGEFSSSNELFNKINSLINWSIQNNMSSVLTDCPHREKLGWLEEDHLMGNSLQYNYNLAALFKKIVADMRSAQTPDGLIPEIAPEYTVFGDGFRDSPEWGSSGILVPWYVYQWYGDKQILMDSYSMMQRYIYYLDNLSDQHILTQGLGDWYDLGPQHPGVSQLTSKGVTATAIFYYDLTILNKIAMLLNKPADAEKYSKLAAEVRIAFNNKFFNKETKEYDTGSQAANAVAVYMRLVKPEYKQAVVDNIVKDVRAHNNSLTAGDIGYRYLLKVLDEAGRSDVIYDMNNRSDVPGYGFQLAKGATALTESWQALSSVSNDHFMLGHLMEWFYEGLAGIKPGPDAVAYKNIVINPQLVGDVTSAKASYHSVYGIIKIDWQKKGKEYDLTVEIPVNTTATIYLPAKANSKISEGGKVVAAVIKNGKAAIKTGSGIYHYTVTQ